MSAKVNNYGTFSAVTEEANWKRQRQGPGNMCEEVFIHHVLPFLKTTKGISLSKKIHQTLSRKVREVAERLKTYHPVRVLFRNHLEEDVPPGTYLSRLNGHIQKLWGKCPNGKQKAKKIEQEFQHVDKAVSAERFERHVDELAKEVLQAPLTDMTATSYRMVKVVRNIGLVLMLLSIATGIALLIFGYAFGIGFLCEPFLCLFFIIPSSIAVYTYEESPFIQEYLGRPLLEVRQELSPPILRAG